MSLNKEYDIRIGTLVGQGQRTPEYISQILPHGFESFQINFWQTTGDTDLERLAAETKEVIDGHDVIVSSLGVFGNPLGDTEIDEQTRESWRKCIDAAGDFGADLVCGFAGRVREKPVPDSIDRYVEVFGELSERAKDKGIRIAFENCPMAGTWESGDWNIAFNPAAWDMMFDALPAENIGLEWEPCHQMGQLIDPIAQLRKYVSKVFHVHGKDASLYHEVIREFGVHGPKPHFEHRHPGLGDSNWTDIISELRRGGYKGTIDIEGWHDPIYVGDLEMTGQVHALEHLKRCRGNYVPNPVGF
ncbi:sugar phosphate isomerase/epimerase family protein [Pelagicoccus mobilis]|uniref:TIM barrel protein n=1 Tax=Pelagicoccus mobilis TaxID=415221 RepID=A0A934VQG5_9BACT|nr:sugar phosphate isomerase/epimerase family protein [Pelagicoccus mobilis]MBK1876875.1 TIM barrel protein [Pelagicoccus mobilis]